MRKSKFPHLPSLNQLLSSKERSVICGEDLLDNEVAAIATDIQAPVRSSTLLVFDRKALTGSKDLDLELKNKSGLLVVVTKAEIKALQSKSKTAKKPVIARDLDTLIKDCKAAKTPLVVMAANGSFNSTVSGLRQSLVHLLQEITLEIHQRIFNTVLEEGMDGLVALLSEELRCPVAVETADFKMVSAESMKSTPVKDRSHLLDQSYKTIEQMSSQDLEEDNFIEIGKRVAIPLIHANKNLVGFLSVLVRQGDNLNDLLWILKPASLACMVHLVQRERGRVLSSANRSMLRELLVNGDLSAVELEKIEIHYGFDLYNSFFIFGVDTKGDDGEVAKNVSWPEERYVSIEAEGTRVFVVPFSEASQASWRDAADKLIQDIKSRNKGVKIQLGASRPVTTLLEFHEAYRQARQSLIIGSMMHTETEYAIGYGDLGLMRLLYLIVDHPELEQFYKEWLGALEEYDEQWDSDLTETLRVYVEQGANLNSAARALFIHRHT